MEGFNLRKVLPGLPSVPYFTFITAAILFLYREGDQFSNISLIVSSFLFIILLGLSLYYFSPIILRHGIKGILFTSFLCISILCITALILFKEITGKISVSHLPEELSSPVVTIAEQKMTRTGAAYHFIHSSEKGGIYKGYLFVQGEIDISPGDTILLHKNVKRSDASEGNFFAKKLYREGIHYRIYAFPDDITIISNGNSIRAAARNFVIDRIDSLFPPGASDMIKALYSGNRNYISSRVVTTFRDSGVLHVLAASGLHVGIIASIPMLLVFTGLSRKFLMGISLLFVLAYLFITDIPVSLVRAAAMFSVLYIQIILNRPINAINSLFIAGSVILILMPWEIYSPGFQLSFGATAGIILFYKSYSRAFSSMPGFLRDSFSVTLAAQSVTAPVIFYHMDQINLASLPANLAVIPLIAAIMISSLTALFLSPVSNLLAGIVSSITGFFYTILEAVTQFFSSFSLNYYAESGSLLLLAAFLMSLIPVINFKRLNKLKFIPVAVSIFIVFTVMEKIYPEDLQSIIITSGVSTLEIYPGKTTLVKLMIKDHGEGRLIMDYFRRYNISPAAIEINEYSFPNIRFARGLINDYRIDELIINENMAASWGMDEIYMLVDSEKINLKFKKGIKN